MSIKSILAGICLVAAMAGGSEASGRGDFNKDGFSDLAIGVPGESVTSGNLTRAGAGAVHVIYGSAGGLTAGGVNGIPLNQFITQHGMQEGDALAYMGDIQGFPDPSEHFGRALAVGDFDGDGYSDLAIGAAAQHVGQQSWAGAVHVIYGSQNGLTPQGNLLITEQGNGTVDGDIVDRQPEGSGVNFADLFGSVLAAGDFDGDEFDDLAMGVPYDDIAPAVGRGSPLRAGAVYVIYGTADGLGSRDEYIVQSRVFRNGSLVGGLVGGIAESGDRFGASLAVGDFNGDSSDDLAIGSPLEDFGVVRAFGAVTVVYGSDDGLSATGEQFITQDAIFNDLPLIQALQDSVESYERFGSSLAAGDFNWDFKDDLAIGTPYEDVGNVKDAGAVTIIHGSSPSGLHSEGNQFITQAGITQGTGNIVFLVGDIHGQPGTGDRFGYSLAAANFGERTSARDGYSAPDDLAVGVFGESLLSIGFVAGAGAVNVIYGQSGLGLWPEGNQYISQAGIFAGAPFSSPDLEGSPEQYDRFGSALSAGDFDGNGVFDLAVGVPYENLLTETSQATVDDAGAAHVIFGSDGGLTVAGNQLWHQDSPGIAETCEADDYLGSALASGYKARTQIR